MPTRVMPDGENIRVAFQQFLVDAAQDPSNQLSVMFGFAWGNDIYASDWLEELLSPSELRARVQSAEEAGLGSISDDDLYVTVAKTGLRYTFCHENDIHVEGDPTSSDINELRSRFLSMGWQVFERINCDGRHGQWKPEAEQAAP
jgi:hypothetical protein